MIESAFRIVVHIWQAPGASEFLAAMLGGSVTLAAQYLALRHDREKEAMRRKDEDRALAWAIFFKISEVHNALSAALKHLQEARNLAEAQKVELWQFYQPAVHDWSPLEWETRELVLLLDRRKFDLMQRYQAATLWLSNLIQSTQAYRQIRVEFLNTTPSTITGMRGTLRVDDRNASQVMPVIAHLRSLSSSLEKVISEQQPEVRKLLIDYAAAMKEMIGVKPEIVIRD